MKLKDYIADKSIFLIINGILFLLIAAIMVFIDASLVIIFCIFIIWFIPLISYIAIQYIQYKNYFNNLHGALEKLDKKHLLPEVLEEVHFIEGKVYSELLKELGRDMYENIKYYKDMQSEYREYIETWVHEVKTPIASAKLLIENNKSDLTNKIDIQMDRIEGFVEQALYYSRSDDVSNDYIIKNFQLNVAINNVIKRNFRDFINKKIKLDLKDINDIVYTDSKWVEFILNQIIINSIKYSNEKNSIISIYTEQKQNSVILTIEDNGIGINERDINRVFEKGFTGENGRVFGKSTGMGLYLCKKLCEKLGLGLKLQSESNKGTKINIIFPKLKL